MRTPLVRRALAALTLPVALLLGTSVVLRPPAAAAPRRAASWLRPVVASVDRPVILYGDSLAWEAQDVFRAALDVDGVRDVITRTYGGTAICDWLAQMGSDAVVMDPAAVVVEFSGNALTPCMQDSQGRPLTGPAYEARYAADAAAVVRTFAAGDTLVFFAGAPISESSRNADGINGLYRALALGDGRVRFADAGASVLDAGRWTRTLPCLAAEPCTGGTDAAGRAVNVVRAPDGLHFCPVARPVVRGVIGACPVWSSGAYRYGTALAQPVLAALAARRR